jgi:hypothetical protein
VLGEAGEGTVVGSLEGRVYLNLGERQPRSAVAPGLSRPSFLPLTARLAHWAGPARTRPPQRVGDSIYTAFRR